MLYSAYMGRVVSTPGVIYTYSFTPGFSFSQNLRGVKYTLCRIDQKSVFYTLFILSVFVVISLGV